MISGIGLDIVEMKRIRRTLERTPRFVERILTKMELDLYLSLSATRKIEFIAGRFSAKEAFSKARGAGIGKECSFLDIEVLKDPKGKPELYFKGEKVNGFISITHTKEYAAAQVLLLDESFNS